jgi:hypothetical protein
MSDIFISYAHIDNEPFGEERARWVSEFADNLAKRLGMVAGDRADVWRDPRLKGNETIWPTIEQALRESRALVSVVSPRYVTSDSCRREIALFVQHWQSGGAAAPAAGAKPLFKVVKTFVPRDQHPEPLRDVNGYEFYQEDEATRRFREFGLDPDPTVRRLYWTRLDDLAQDLGAFLGERQGTPEPSADPTVVYVAQTTRDVREAREAIVRELKDRHVEVVPVGDLPSASDELQARVRGDLARADFAVHIVGERDGFAPEGDARSVIEIQYALALESRTPGLLWRPRPRGAMGTTSGNGAAALADRLAGSAIPENGFDFLQGTLDEVKALLLARLTEPRAAPHAPAPEAGRRVYLVYLRSELASVESLESALRERLTAATPAAAAPPMVTFLAPIERGTPAQLRTDHETKLRTSDAVVVVCGRARTEWIEAKITELRKSGLAAAPSPKAVFYQPPGYLPLDGFPTAHTVDGLVDVMAGLGRQ